MLVTHGRGQISSTVRKRATTCFSQKAGEIFKSFFKKRAYGCKKLGPKRSLLKPPDQKLVPSRNRKTREKESALEAGIPARRDAATAQGLNSHRGQGDREGHGG